MFALLKLLTRRTYYRCSTLERNLLYVTNPKPAVITTPISSPPNNAPSIGPTCMLVLDDLTTITGNTYICNFIHGCFMRFS